MERMIDDRNILNQFCEEFCRIIEKYCEYIIVSGFLAIASGRTRGTEDIDMIVERISLEQFKKIFKELYLNQFVCMQSDSVDEAYEYLKDNTAIRFTKKDKPLPEMEMKFAKDLLDIYQIKNKVKYEITQVNVWFSNVNINIAFKEEYLKSPKDLEDAIHLRIMFSEFVSETEIRSIKKMIRELRL